ncbi:hypothetical protein M9458_027055 [Cirrhinus mrigala]|uniref:Uncharacterized protein n=1 Tax=Cirrhinus mrigala TaxID=683832 RepID=A0ABD0PXK6_CIRMR
MSWSPTPSTAAEDGALIDWESEIFLHVSFPGTTLLESVFPPSLESPVSLVVPPKSDSPLLSGILPNLPLPPPHPKPPSLSALPLVDEPVSISVLGCQSHGFILVLRALDSTLAFHAPLSSVSPQTPPGFLVPPAPPWSVIDLPPPWSSMALAAPHPSIPLAPSLGPASLWLHLGPSLAFGITQSFCILGVGLAPAQSVISLVLPGKAPPWLLPPSTPLWVCILALMMGVPPWLHLRPGFFCSCHYLLCSGSLSQPRLLQASLYSSTSTSQAPTLPPLLDCEA